MWRRDRLRPVSVSLQIRPSQEADVPAHRPYQQRCEPGEHQKGCGDIWRQDERAVKFCLHSVYIGSVKMKIQYVSDLHLEFRPTLATKILTVTGDILILAGDVSPCGLDYQFHVFETFLNHYTSKYKHIIHVAGNHEYYADSSSTEPWTMRVIQNKLLRLNKQFPNYHFLHDRVICIDRATFVVTYPDMEPPFNGRGLCIIGSTLWTHIPEAEHSMMRNRMNDYHEIFVSKQGQITNITPSHVTACYERHAAFIRKALRHYSGKDKVLIVTHHKPYKATDPSKSRKNSNAYHSDFLHYLAQDTNLAAKVLAVIYGHTHEHDHETTRFPFPILSNPKGYPNQHTGYVDGEAIEG